MEKTLLLLSFCLGICVNRDINAQNGGQKILVWQNHQLLGGFDQFGGTINASSPTFSFTVTDDSITVPNLPCPGNPCGWYKGFWILGDGNYKKYEDDNANLDAASKSLNNYTYAKSGTYSPAVYLTEKYTNTEPPPRGIATIRLYTEPETPGVEITKRLANSPGKKLDIDYMHGLRKGYPTPLVLSYRKTEPANKLLLFYNCLKTAPDPSSWSPSSLLEYQNTEVPDYFFSNAGISLYSDLDDPRGPYLSDFGGGALARLQDNFKNCIAYDVSNPSTVPTGFEEMRMFPVLKTKKLEQLPGAEIPTDSVVFVSILIGNQALPTSDPAYNALYSSAVTLLGTPISSDLALSSNAFIRGIAIQNFKIGTSHDPNHLKVSSIENLGQNQYRIHFEIRVCNHSETPETRPSFIFKDLSNGKFSGRPVFLGLSEKVRSNWTSTDPLTLTLDGHQISGAPPGMESCSDLQFYIDTDLEGLQLIQNQARVLEVCVEFSAGEGDCSENEPYTEEATAEYRFSSSKGWLSGILACIAVLVVVLMARVSLKSKL